MDPHQGERGQVIVLWAGALAVLLLLSGLVIDTGFAFVQRRDAQNVSDLASLAGTKAVADYYVNRASSADVDGAIQGIAQANGCVAGRNCSWRAWYVDASGATISEVTPGASPLPGGTLGVRVDVHWPATTFLVGAALSAMGLDAISIWDVNTTATSETADSTEYSPAGLLLPLALYGQSAQSFSPGHVYDITDAVLNTPGNFGWLTWSGAQDANTLTTSVCTSDNPGFALPSYIDGSTGAKNQGGTSGSGIADCLNTYKHQQTSVLIPVYDFTQGTGSNTQYHIIGVVAMTLTEVNWAPAVKEIKGYFQQVYQFQPGAIPPGAGAQPPVPGSKFYYLGLVH